MNLYEYAVDYLKKHTDGLTDSILEEYLKVNKADSLDEAFSRGVASVVDTSKQFMANAISYSDPQRKTAIDNVLCGLNLKKFRKKYGNDVDRLFNDLCNAVNVPANPKGAWYKFAKNIITFADYLSEFKDIGDLYSAFDNAKDVNAKIKLVNTVSARISQWGFAMASNWLKDMGMTGFCKPDRHVLAIIDGIYQTGQNEKNIFAKVIEIAEECGVTPFVLDRVLFLVGSGDFYSHKEIKKSYNGNEQDFIKNFFALRGKQFNEDYRGQV